MDKPRVVLDFDNVLANTAGRVLEIHNNRRAFGDPVVTIDQITQWDHPLFHNIVRQIMDPLFYGRDGTYYWLMPIAGATQGWNTLYNEGYDLVIATNSPLGRDKLIRGWLGAWGFKGADEVPIFYGPDKRVAQRGYYNRSILVDDFAANVAQAQGPAILLDQPWNRDEYITEADYRALDWNYVVHKIHELYPMPPVPAVQPDHDTETLQVFDSGARRSRLDGVRYDLISPYFLTRLAARLAYGAKKYGDRNWERGMPTAETLNHLEAHLNAYKRGDTSDDNLAGVAFGVMALIHFEEKERH